MKRNVSWRRRALAVRRKTLIRRSGVEWTDYNANIYHGCAHNCRYCYARLMTKRFEPNPLDWRDVKIVENAVELARRDIRALRPGRIMFCSMTDPYQPIEAETGLARKVLEVRLDSPFHVLILTKSPLVTRDYDLIRGHSNVEVGFTITSLDDIPFWEPYAPGNKKRTEALKKAHSIGIKTFVSIEPWIPEMTHPQSIAEKLKDDIDRFIIGSMQYSDVPRRLYTDSLPCLITWLDENKINYYRKKELRSCILSERKLNGDHECDL